MEAPCCSNAMDFVTEKLQIILKKYITELPVEKQKQLIKELVRVNPKFINIIDSLKITESN